MKPKNLIGIVFMIAVASTLGWVAGQNRCMKLFYAYEADFYGGKLQEMDKKRVDLKTGLGAFISARYVYCANRGDMSEFESSDRFLPENVSEFQNGFGNEPCLYKEELEEYRKKRSNARGRP